MENVLFGMFIVLMAIAFGWFITKSLGLNFPGYFIDLGKYLLLVFIICIFIQKENWFWSIIFGIITIIVFLLSKKK